MSVAQPKQKACMPNHLLLVKYRIIILRERALGKEPRWWLPTTEYTTSHNRNGIMREQNNWLEALGPYWLKKIGMSYQLNEVCFILLK